MKSRKDDSGEPRFSVLRLARRSLLVIAACVVVAAFVYVRAAMEECKAEEAAGEVFEFVKVGLLPLAVLILTYYFRKDDGAGDGN